MTIGADELRLMQGLAQRVAAIGPQLLNGDATMGELAWVWGMGVDTLAPFWRHRLWFADGVLAGWGWAQLPRAAGEPANLTWQVHPARPALLPQVLGWYDEVADGLDRALVVQSADAAAQAAVAAHGYRFDAEEGGDGGGWHQFNARGLAELPEPVLPAGFRFLAASDVAPADAVRAHRAAWPGSSFSEAAFARVRRTWPYRGDLHVLVAAPDGTPAASAIIWLDEATGTAEFEPVGTDPGFRRRGLGRALQLHGMRLARAAGARLMLVACLGAPAHPAARGLYRGVGFRPIGRDLPQIRRRDQT
jgi:ribosomal protein S18 acetylase RimI-like enzyme